MSDRAVFALAVAVCAAAWSSAPVPLLLAVTVTAAALISRRPVLLVAGAALLASSLGARSDAGLTPPAGSEAVTGEAVLSSDPVNVDGATKVDVGLGVRRVEAWARGQPAAVLAPLLAGERVKIEGRLRPPPPEARPWLARRHVSARLSVDQAGPSRPGSLASRAANGLRRTLVNGARPLATEERALLTGFVFGDDRDQSVAVADDFKAAGLTHLLAVSGQNVAFVLVLAGPVLRRLGLRGRWAASLAVIGFFGLVTRWEPSVLRASAMAALACTATGLGRPTSCRRLLALAVAGVVLIDPLVVRSVGFQLSVGACVGILLLAAPLSRHLPGPRWLAEVLAVTLAAQVGVAPVLVPVFGGLPVASLPANLLAVPAAGPLMVWGLTAGLAAGVLGPPADALLHQPTSWLVRWVAAVARWAAALPLGRIEIPHLVALVVIGAVTAMAWRRSRRLALRLGSICTALVLVAPSLALALPRSSHMALTPAPGAELWADRGVVLVIDDAGGASLLEGLRAEGVSHIDVVICQRGGSPAAATVLLLRSRLSVGVVLAPEDHRIRGAKVPLEDGVVQVGGIAVKVVRTSPNLEVEVGQHE
ncbi:MAG TPA: ComEC/Rec2 family competence protein [Acidimicrobiales bacterium]|nr:ComEC/Rec2 family competence protein [Acidimicrobiales bacterium]